MTRDLRRVGSVLVAVLLATPVACRSREGGGPAADSGVDVRPHADLGEQGDTRGPDLGTCSGCLQSRVGMGGGVPFDPSSHESEFVQLISLCSM